MAISIRNPLAENLAREIAAKSGETITRTIIQALEDRLEKLQGRRVPGDLLQEIKEISSRCADLPLLDQKSADEILGYDKNGY